MALETYAPDPADEMVRSLQLLYGATGPAFSGQGTSPDPTSGGSGGLTRTVMVDHVEKLKGADLNSVDAVLVYEVSRSPMSPSTLGYGHVTREAVVAVELRTGGRTTGAAGATNRARMKQLLAQLVSGLHAIRKVWDDINAPAGATAYNKFFHVEGATNVADYLWLEIGPVRDFSEREANVWRVVVEVKLIHPFVAVPEGAIE